MRFGLFLGRLTFQILRKEELYYLNIIHIMCSACQLKQLTDPRVFLITGTLQSLQEFIILYQFSQLTYQSIQTVVVHRQILYLLIISLNLTFLSDRCSLLFDGALRSPETHGIFPNPRGDSVFLAGCFVVGLVLD